MSTMATKAEQRRNTIAEFLEGNPGAHTAEQVAQVCGFTPADTARALGQLARNGTIAETDPDERGAARWTATDAVETAGEDTVVSGETPGDATGTGPTGPDADESEPELPAGVPAPEVETGPAAPSEAADANSAGTIEDATEGGAKADPADPEEAGPDAMPEGDGQTGRADIGGEGAEDQSPAESDGNGAGAAPDETESEPVPDPDPAVLLLTGQLSVLDGPVGLEAITLAAFKVAGPKQTETALHALCSLAFHGAVECSEPFAPDDRDRAAKVAWTVTVDAAELDRVAAVAQLADAPHATVCPTCKSEIGLPHPRGVGRARSASNGRVDGRRRLADGELRDMILTLIRENPGEELKPGDFLRELKNDPRFKDRVSPNSSGAVRSALVKLAEGRVWIEEIENRQPLTYRCFEAQ